MRILIVEDDQNKLRQLASFIRNKWPGFVIDESRSYQSGLEKILSGGHDLVLLDMSMPTYDRSPHETGGRPRKFAGKEILRKMQRKALRTPVLIVTQFESFSDGGNLVSLQELRQQLRTGFLDNYIDTVYYNSAHDNWQFELERHISQVQESGES